MTVLMFCEQFADAVANGTKRQTIRPARKRPILVGDLLSLRRWEGVPYRSKQVVLREARCTRTVSLRISNQRVTWESDDVDSISLTASQLGEFAIGDGFSCYEEMLDFIRATYSLPFSGEVIWWEVAS